MRSAVCVCVCVCVYGCVCVCVRMLPRNHASMLQHAATFTDMHKITVPAKMFQLMTALSIVNCPVMKSSHVMPRHPHARSW